MPDKIYNVLFLCTGNSAALERRIKIFTSLPIAKLDRMTLRSRVEAIGRLRDDAVEGRAS
jgi:hypothetical protein